MFRLACVWPIVVVMLSSACATDPVLASRACTTDPSDHTIVDPQSQTF
jgi:hypothetical protein